MKKLMSLLVVAAMLLCMVSAVAETETITYYLNTVVSSGMTMNAADLGYSIVLTLASDGTVKMESSDTASEGTWTREDNTLTVTLGGEDTVFVINEDNTLYIDAGSSEMYFSTEAPVATSFGDVIAADSVSAFNGDWTCAYVNVGGAVVEIAAVADQIATMVGSDNLNIVIDEGNVAAFGEEAMAFTLTDGALTFAIEGNEWSNMKVTLTDAGYMIFNMLGMDFICTK